MVGMNANPFITVTTAFTGSFRGALAPGNLMGAQDGSSLSGVYALANILSLTGSPDIGSGGFEDNICGTMGIPFTADRAMSTSEAPVP